MECSDILQGLSQFCVRYDSQTYLGSYRETTRSSLLNDGLSTRANSLWKMAEYVVAKRGANDNDDNLLNLYLDGWRRLASNQGNQYLLLEISLDNWRIYDSTGTELGDEDYIRHFFAERNQKTQQEPLPSNLKHQVIFFGAPGTGKSYKLNQKSSLFEDHCVERVTFYPTYTYQQFVGAYKPSMMTTTNSDGQTCHSITYSYVPGPFLRQLVKAMQQPDQQFLVIIEELNRANAAAVFGDVFQLLDRKSDGCSEFPVAVSEDMKRYLEDLNDENVRVATNGYTFLVLPPNFYIWATMNSADQGVFPLDTAFKRRWEFEYLGIDENEDKITGCRYQFKDGTYKWNEIRKAINNKLLEKNVSEDKLVGPFFIKKEILDDESGVPFFEAFKSKVLMYLFEDAMRHHPAGIFKTDNGVLSYSSIRKRLDEGGLEAIFNFPIEKIQEENQGEATTQEKPQ